MAFNNQPIGNAPISTFTAASDEIGGVQFQRVKIVSGAEGSTESVEGTAANGLAVDVTRVQGTVAVSGSVTISDGSGPVTVDGTVAATQSGAWSVGLAAGANNVGSVDVSSLPSVSLASQNNPFTTAIPVSGTLGATQSGAWSVGLDAGTNNIGDVDVLTLPSVQIASQANPFTTAVPVSGTVTITDGSGPVTVDGTVSANQSGTWNIGTLTSITNAVPVTDNSGSLTVDAPTTAPLNVRITDSNRTELRFYAVAAAAGTTGTETAITLTRSSGTSATSTGASWTVTNAKRFKIIYLSFATRGNNTATAQTTTFNFRINTGGAVTTTSTPIILAARSATPATANAWDRVVISLPGDGLELVGTGTLQFGITAAATYVTNAPTWDVTMIGYEY